MNGSDMAHRASGAADGRRPETPARPLRIFLTYASSERRLAGVLAADLRKQGFAIGSTSPNASESMLPRLIQTGKQPDSLLVILDPAALQAPLVAEEMRLATTLLQNQQLRAVFAIVAAPPDGSAVPAWWPNMQIIDATRDYDSAVAQLIAAIEAAGSIRQPSNDNLPPPPTVPKSALVSPPLPEPMPAPPPIPAIPASMSPIARFSPFSPAEDASTRQAGPTGGTGATDTREPASSPNAQHIGQDIEDMKTARMPATQDIAEMKTARVPRPAMDKSAELYSIRMPAQARRQAQDAFGQLEAAARASQKQQMKPPMLPISISLLGRQISRRELLRGGAAVAAVAAVGGIIYTLRPSEPAPATTPRGPSVRWHTSLGHPPTTLAVTDSGIYVGTGDGRFLAIDATSHQQRWSYSANAPVMPVQPVIANGAVYFTTSGMLYSVSDDPTLTTDAQRLRWSFHLDGRQFLRPTVGDGVIFAPSLYYRLHALDSTTGEIRWMAASSVNPASSPVLVNDRMYIASSHTVLALDLDGNIIWKGADTGVVHGNLSVLNGVIYAGSLENAVYALDADSGAQQWRFTTVGPVNTTPLVDESLGGVYVGGSDKNLYALNLATGELRWQQELDSPLGSPVMVDRHLYVSSETGNLYALDPITGVIYWQYVAGQGVLTPLGTGSATLYVGTEDQSLYALGVP